MRNIATFDEESSDRIRATLAASGHLADQWVRMPRDKQRLCGLSRTTILELAEGGHIRTAAIIKPGRKKGIRLVFLPSLLAYLETLPAGHVGIRQEVPANGTT